MNPVRKLRSDAYPEHTDYRDSGCDLHPRCLDCPLARCRYDGDNNGIQSIRRDARAKAVIGLVSDGASAAAAALKIGISLRAAMRYVASAGGVAVIRRSGRQENHNAA